MTDHEMKLPPPPPPPPPPEEEDFPSTSKECNDCDCEPAPSSISTSPASSHDEFSLDHPTIHQWNVNTNTCTTSNHDNAGSNQSYSTPPLASPNHRKTILSSTSNQNSDHLDQEETIDLIQLATTTMASTIIASKVIQKYSTQLSSANCNSHTNPSNFSMSQSSIQSECSTNTATTTGHGNHSTTHEKTGQQPPSSPKPQPLLPNSSRTKTDGSIVTDADGESQRIITSYIRSISSSIRIVGEETNDEIQISQKQYYKNTWWGVSPGSKRKLMKKEKKDEDYIFDLVTLEMERRCGNVAKASSSSENSTCAGSTSDANHECDMGDIHSIHPNRVSIYVDPLDGTGAYAKGQYEAVTILAGIMVDNVPVFGVIVKPFGHDGCNVNFDIGAYSTSTTKTDTTKLATTGTSSSSQHPPKSQSTSKATNKYFYPFSTYKKNHQDDPCSKLGFKYPCSAVYGGTLLGGAFIFSGDELTKSRIHRTPSMSTTPLSSFTSLDIQESKESTDSSSSSSSSSSSTSFSIKQTSSAGDIIPNKQRKAIISKSRGGGVVKQCIDSLSSKGLLHPEPIYITGAGYKTMRLLLGTHNETMWFFPKPGTSLWDVAAADALLRVMGGRLSDKFGDDLDYSKSWTDADNLDGIVACSDVDLHAKCIELYRDECWNDED